MSRQLRTFRVGSVSYGIDVLDVQALISSHPLARLTALRSEVFGAACRRGRVMIEIDLRHCLARGGVAGVSLPANVVVHTESGAASFAVDEIGDVVEVDETSLRPLRAAASAAVGGVVSGVYRHQHELLHLVDAAIVAGMSEGPALFPRSRAG